jgi:hypothetical protein
MVFMTSFDKRTASTLGSDLFNPHPQISRVALSGNDFCYVIDNALTHPEQIVEWARANALQPPRGFPYPGLVLNAPHGVARCTTEFFSRHVRGLMGARRTLDAIVRVSLVTLRPEQLDPLQWQCHRDRIAANPLEVLFAASVLYLFRNPALGGTSFYVPRRSAAQTDRMIADSQTLDANEFSARHGVVPGYMAGSNAYFERIATVPAAWNRLIIYDGSLFHSAEIEQPALMSSDPARGRLTLNGFFTCKRRAQ